MKTIGKGIMKKDYFSVKKGTEVYIILYDNQKHIGNDERSFFMELDEDYILSL